MKIAIIGGGNMGGAIARGLSRDASIRPEDITVTAATRKTLDALAAFCEKLRLTTDNAAAVKGADLIVLAVKPWIAEGVIEEIAPEISDDQAVLSLVAGLDFARIQEGFGKAGRKPALFRIMPNTAIEIGRSMTLISACGATPEQKEAVKSVFEKLGAVSWIEERLMAAGAALCSCGMAYALRYIRAAMEGGVEMGFYPEQAQEIVARTVEGAAALLLAKGTHPEEEIDRVTTPGGVTIRGLNEMEAAGFTSAVIRGLKAGR